MEKDNKFPNGIAINAPRENAPEFIKARVSFKVSDAVEWLKANENNNGWVDCDLKESKAGKLYLELNAFKPQRPATQEMDETAVPF